MVTGVEFDEDKFRYSRPTGFTGNAPAGSGYPAPGNVPTTGMSGWLVRHGLAKSGTGAQVVLIIVILANIAITYFVVRNFL